jgi:mismatch-specific thymine-DNA glycosylase
LYLRFETRLRSTSAAAARSRQAAGAGLVRRHQSGCAIAQTGHHFAGYSNRFWKLLYDARIVPEPITFEDDDRLHEWGLGITNLIARATPGIDTLEPDEYIAGVRILRRKVRRWQPEIVALSA